jgi:hypothetical protein
MDYDKMMLVTMMTMRMVEMMTMRMVEMMMIVMQSTVHCITIITIIILISPVYHIYQLLFIIYPSIPYTITQHTPPHQQSSILS